MPYHYQNKIRFIYLKIVEVKTNVGLVSSFTDTTQVRVIGILQFYFTIFSNTSMMHLFEGKKHHSGLYTMQTP